MEVAIPLQYVVAIVAVVAAALVWLVSKRSKPAGKSSSGETTNEEGTPLRILYGTTTGKSKEFAEALLAQADTQRALNYDVSITNMSDYDQDNLEQESVVVFILSTWTGGQPPESCKVFYSWLEDMANDFRVGPKFLANVKFAVFGLGNEEYDEHFCTAAKKVSATGSGWMGLSSALTSGVLSPCRFKST